ncbi:MAG: hypothetical protein G01um101420_82 [Parcubacteria group bacterium Gr01-1014_20]|nr:MAG: hypothetical protein G01um101420_82 [Parcubacteria group bacterium Gr01-1014_20]
MVGALSIVAKVLKVVPERNYAVTLPNQEVEGVEGSITFSLTKEVWEGEGAPHEGQLVVLEDIAQTGRGWRAYKARAVRPEDQT